MPPDTIAYLLLIVFVAAYVQSNVGFGIGLIVVSTATVFDVVPVIFSAALVSFTSCFHMLLAMKGEWRSVDWPRAKLLVIGLVPGVFVGVQLLDLLSQNSIDLLKAVLGVVVLLAATVSLLSFQQYKRDPGPLSTLLVGLLGGLGGGMFSNSAPPIVYHLHRQDMPFLFIRNTLFVVFLASTVTRISLITAKGDVDRELLLTVAVALPVIALSTWLAKKYSLPLGKEKLRKLTFVLLAIIGVSLLLT